MSTEPIEPGPHRILVVNLASFGDALLATPAIGALRAAYPQARIDVLTTPIGAAIFAMCPAVDRIIKFPKELFDRPAAAARPDRLLTVARLAGRLRAGRYDAVALLHHLTTRFGALKFRGLLAASGAARRAGLDNGRGTFLTHRAPDYGFGVRTEWQYGLDVAATLGARVDGVRPSIVIPDAARLGASRLLEQMRIREPYIVIHPGVGGYSQARAWPAERFAAMASRIHETTGQPIVVVGTEDEAARARVVAEQPGAVNLIGQTSLPDLAAVVERAALTIGSDSGVAHLAAALDRPLLAIFGPSNSEAWRPFGADLHFVGRRSLPAGDKLVIRSAIPCAPCFYTGFSLGRREGCALKTCLDEVTVDEVVPIALRILQRQNVPMTHAHDVD